MESVYTAKEAADYLKLHVVVIRNYIREGRIRASKVGTKWLITETALKEFLESREVTAPRFIKGNESGRFDSNGVRIDNKA